MLSRRYPIPELAKIASVSERTLRDIIKRGQVRTVKVGGQWRVTEEDWLAYEALGATGGKPSAEATGKTEEAAERGGLGLPEPEGTGPDHRMAGRPDRQRTATPANRGRAARSEGSRAAPRRPDRCRGARGERPWASVLRKPPVS